MPWIIKTPKPHPCALPPESSCGDVWECDDCGQGWRIYDNLGILGWHRISERALYRIKKKGGLYI